MAKANEEEEYDDEYDDEEYDDEEPPKKHRFLKFLLILLLLIVLVVGAVARGLALCAAKLLGRRLCGQRPLQGLLVFLVARIHVVPRKIWTDANSLA